MDLNISTEERAGVAIIALDGELDVYTAPRLRDAIVALDAGGQAWVVMDLERCEYYDSTGLGVIVGALKRARARGGDIALVVTSERMLKPLRTSGLIKVFAVRDSVDEAVGEFAGRAQLTRNSKEAN